MSDYEIFKGILIEVLTEEYNTNNLFTLMKVVYNDRGHEIKVHTIDSISRTLMRNSFCKYGKYEIIWENNFPIKLKPLKENSEKFSFQINEKIEIQYSRSKKLKRILK